MTETGDGKPLYAWLAGAVEANAAIITSSRRLARELRAEYDRQQVAADRMAWSSPLIVFWQDWLADILRSSASVEVSNLIDGNASTILWERSVRRYLDNPSHSSQNLLRQARTAWQRLLEWRVSISELSREARGNDERAFAEAANHYHERLIQGQWLDSEQVAAESIKLLREERVAVAGQIVYAGFDRLSPILEELLTALRETGRDVVAAPQRTPAATMTTCSYSTIDAELRAAGAWARARLTDDPAARIGIVIADLEKESARFARLIREGLAPGWQGGASSYARAVNVSYGLQLSKYPAIHIALLCLRWIHQGLRSRDVSILLRSPFLGVGHSAGRPRLELRLRGLPDRQWTAAALAAALTDQTRNSEAQEWLDGVRRIAALQTRVSERNAPVTWARLVDELLAEIGWPGAGKLNSDEFQLINRWRNLLNEFASLDNVMPQMTLSDAIYRLENLARSAVYQPDSGPGLVNLLGSLEAAGMEFDHLWIAGMDATRWPSSGQPMALVSRNLQRVHSMPDASPQDTLEYSRRVIRRLTVSARNLHFSWARTEQDTAQLQSPLLNELPVNANDICVDPYWYVDTLIDAADVREVANDPVPGIDGFERVSGGAYTVQRQTVEPFAAFAHGRLGIEELRRFEGGLSASLRGSLLHESLFQLMRQKPSREAISAWSDQEIRDRIDAAIDTGFSQSLRHADAVLRRLMAMERMRLHAVITQFLTMEKARPEFCIEHVEERIDFEFAGVQLTLRADRIDRLSDGTLLIIDYKTGRVKNLLAQDGSPVDLQVVVYAAALDTEVGGLALFNIGSREIVYKGVGGSVEWNQKTDDQWREMLGSWKSLVRSAMEQIALGDARINLQLNAAQSRPLNVLSRVEEQKRAI